jgi:hypothetical protein
MDMLADAAKEMSSVKAKILVFNTGNDYPVSGNQLIYTMSGEVTTGNGTNSWRMMSSGGQAGDGQAHQPRIMWYQHWPNILRSEHMLISPKQWHMASYSTRIQHDC